MQLGLGNCFDYIWVQLEKRFSPVAITLKYFTIDKSKPALRSISLKSKNQEGAMNRSQGQSLLF